MKPRPQRLYVAEAKESGLILMANGRLLINSNRAELRDDANDVAPPRSFVIVRFDRHP